MSLLDNLRTGTRGRAATGYDGASHGRRLGLWNTGNSNINALIAASGNTLVNRSRDIVRKNSWASEIRAEWVSNAVGTGILPEFLHPAENVKKIFEEGWKRFADEADADGRVDVYGLQELACGEIIEGSESISRLRPRLSGDGLLAPLQVQLLQSEQLPLYLNQFGVGGNPVRCGIEFNAIGKRVAYHLLKEHPGAGATALTLNTGLTTRVPAESVIHAFRMIQAGQMRGEPWLSRALTRLYQFDQFVDATLGRQKLGAFMLGWLKSASNPDEGGPLNKSATAPDGTTAPEATRFGSIEPDTIMELAQDEELDFFKQPEISTQYEQFVSSQLREIFACAGMTLEQFDVSKVNYSSIRQGTLKFRRRCEQFQFSTLCWQFNRPLANAWMDAFVLYGGSDAIADRLHVERIKAADYAKNRDLYQRIEWRTPAWAWVDPLKDVLAIVAEIRAGLKPLSVAIRERGYNPLDVLKQYADDRDLMAKYGLVFDTDASKVSKTGKLDDPLATTADTTEPPPTPAEKALAAMVMQ